MAAIITHWLDEVSYEEALQLQLDLRRAVLAGMHPGALLLLTHPPTITIGRHGNTDNVLNTRGAAVHRIERGGDVTFHGPGQLVGYPIVNLNTLKMGVQRYVHSLATILSNVVSGWGITAHWDAKTPGLWVGGNKLAAVGIHVHRGVATHGFALNVSTDLSWFDTIVPCGLSGRGVTSMKAILGEPCPSIPQLCEAIRSESSRVFGVEFEYNALPFVEEDVQKRDTL
jgi:lipoyl(octanoyl) transferase